MNGYENIPTTPCTFQQAPRVDRPPQTFSYATLGSLPATQWQRLTWLEGWSATTGSKRVLWLGWLSEAFDHDDLC